MAHKTSLTNAKYSFKVTVHEFNELHTPGDSLRLSAYKLGRPYIQLNNVFVYL